MTLEEMKADVFRYVKRLSVKTGVDIDPEKVWEELQAHITKPDDGQQSS